MAEETDHKAGLAATLRRVADILEKPHTEIRAGHCTEKRGTSCITPPGDEYAMSHLNGLGRLIFDVTFYDPERDKTLALPSEWIREPQCDTHV